MGNAVTRVSRCCAASGDISRRHDIAVYLGDPLHDGLGHSFCYIRPDPACFSNTKIHCEETVTFRSISGASVSANASTPSSTTLIDASSQSSGLDRASTFESSELFASIPLQPVPRGQFSSGSVALVPGGSGPMERGFLSGPIERGFLSGPIDRGLYSDPEEKEEEKQSQRENLQRSFEDQEMKENDKPKKQGLIKILKRAVSNTISGGKKLQGSKESDSETVCENGNVNLSRGSTNMSDQDQVRLSNGLEGGSELSADSQNLQWAQGKAGEDRVHIVISEEHGWAGNQQSQGHHQVGDRSVAYYTSTVSLVAKSLLPTRRRLRLDPPTKLFFPYEPGKQVRSAIGIKNICKSHVAFKFQTTAPKSCYMRPPGAILAPSETIIATVFKFVEPPENNERPAALDQKIWVKFKIMSLKVKGEMEYVPEMFDEQKDQVAVEQILRVVFLDPECPSPALEKLKRQLAEAEAQLEARKKPPEEAGPRVVGEGLVIDEWKERRERYLAQQQIEVNSV